MKQKKSGIFSLFARDQKVSAMAYDSAFAALYKFLAVSAVFAILSPIASVFLFEGSILKALFYLLAGYGIQAFLGLLFHYKRVKSLPESSHWKRSISKKLHAITFIPAILLAILAFVEHYKYLKWAFYNTIEVAYDPNPIAPFITAAVVLFLVSAGSVIWFVPHDRIISYKSVWGLASVDAVFFVVFHVFMFYTTTAQAASYIIGTAVFIICAMILLNQSYILKTYEFSSDTVLSPSARIYNITLVMIIAVAAALLFSLVYVIANGIVMLGRMFLFTLVGGFVAEETYAEAEEVAARFDEVVFARGLMGEALAPEFMKVIFGIFIAVVIFAGCYLIFGRGSGFFSRLLSILVSIYNWLLEFFLDPINARWNFNDIDEDTEYLDRVVMDETYEQVDYRPKRRDLTYHDFTRAMAALPNDDARMRYAYAVLVKHWCAMNLGITKSDTPGEICAKLKNKTELPHTEEMTAVFQALQYAGETGLGSENSALLDSMCALVKHYRTI
ncbi:MAG: hypothetical protein IJA85_02660 [Clostridia bacterium]|nr:hypothetical protein [Clostridia bacterium]